MKRGKFIVIEGSEGSGKSSQMKKLQDKFPDAMFTREPGGTPYAEEIREIILNSKHASQADAKTLFALFWASRADHIKNKILPALESGKTVIADRFDSSTYAYQIFGQEAQNLKESFFIFRDFFLGDTKPDLYIYLEVDAQTGLSRKSGQIEEINHFEKRKVDFFERMAVGYEEFLGKVNSIKIDANPPFDVVNTELTKVIEDFIK